MDSKVDIRARRFGPPGMQVSLRAVVKRSGMQAWLFASDKAYVEVWGLWRRFSGGSPHSKHDHTTLLFPGRFLPKLPQSRRAAGMRMQQTH